MRIYLLLLIPIFCPSAAYSQSFEENPNNLLKVRYGDMELVDLDNDGDNDLIVTGSVGDYDYTYTYRNDGNGNFDIIQSNELPNVGFSNVTTGDIDSDGDLDMFVTGYWQFSGYHSELLLNDGNGYFTTDPSSFQDVAMGCSKLFDADNDGDLDLFYFGRFSFGHQVTKLCFNDGQGNFTESAQFFAPNEIGSLEIADVNSDGYLDILMSGQATGVMSNTKLMMNNGDGTFIQSSESFQGVSFGIAHFIDLETDGDKDIIINGFVNGVASYHSCFYINDGAGQYEYVGNRGLDSLGMNTLVDADIDQDGDLDIFLSGKTKNSLDTCAMYYNNNGFFTKDLDFKTQGLFDGDAVFGKIDNNCSPDLIYCGFGDDCLNGSYTYLNLEVFEDDCIELPSDSSDKELPLIEYIIYSNPFTDAIRIDVNLEVDHVWIYDSRGRLVKEKYQDDKSILMDLNNLESGVYFVRFNVSKWDILSEEKLLKLY